MRLHAPRNRDGGRKRGRRMDYVLLAQTGGHIEGIFHEGAITVRSPDRKVGPRAISRVRCLNKDCRNDAVGV